MISFRTIAKSCRDFGQGLGAELKQLRGETQRWRLERKARKQERKAERRERREARRLEYAKGRAWLALEAQLNDEERKSEMYARIADASVANIGDARLYELRRKGIETAYDVYCAGVDGLTSINSIGAGIAQRLYEWALSHEPPSVVIDLANPEHSSRFDALTRAYLQRT